MSIFDDWEKTSPVSIKRGDYSIARFDGEPVAYLIFKRTLTTDGIPWWDVIPAAKQPSCREAVEWVNAQPDAHRPALELK